MQFRTMARVVANSNRLALASQGKCHRDYTALTSVGVRVKRVEVRAPSFDWRQSKVKNPTQCKIEQSPKATGGSL